MPPRSVTSAQGRTTARSGGSGMRDNRPDDRPPSGMSPGRAQAQFGTPALAGFTPAEAQSFVSQAQKDPSGEVAQNILGPAGAAAALATQANIQAQQAYEAATLQQLQQDLRDIERRRASAMLPGSLGFFQDLNLKNLANQISGAGLTTATLTPTQLASMQQRVIRDAAGRVIGYRDARGVLTGRDPQQEEEERLAQRGQGGMDARPMYTAPDPQTGECDPGYIFDEDLQACRLDTGVSAPVDFGDDVPTYARMGLLDVAPTGLLEFGQRFGTSPGDFGAANLAFRRATGTRPSYFQAPPKLDGYTLLS